MRSANRQSTNLTIKKAALHTECCFGLIVNNGYKVAEPFA